MFKETLARSIYKSISYRILGTLQTTVVVYAFSGDLSLSLSAGAIDMLFKIFLYSLHERIWDKISFGKRKIVPRVIWLTGLSGAGKSTIAVKLVEKLKQKKVPVESLDGDVIRAILHQTGFSKEERIDHIKRVGYLASRLELNGVFVVVALISPFEEARSIVKSYCQNFLLAHVHAPLEVCEQRDVKGLYQKARKGELKNFTGIDSPYEEPQNPDVKLDTSKLSVDQCVEKILDQIGKI